MENSFRKILHPDNSFQLKIRGLTELLDLSVVPLMESLSYGVVSSTYG